MAELAEALDRVRGLLLDEHALVRAVGAGRRRGARPPWQRIELRWVDLRGGRQLQLTARDATQAFTTNHHAADAAAAVDALLAEPFGNWHVWSAGAQGEEQLQLRVTKRGDALVHVFRTTPAAGPPDVAPHRAHDRSKPRLLDPADPVLHALGITDGAGRVKPSRQAKLRQVEEFLRHLDTSLGEAVAAGALPAPEARRPLRLVDLGCGNAYLTLAAHRFLTAVRGLAVEVVGVDLKAQSRAHNTALAAQLGIADQVRFAEAAIGDPDLPVGAPDVVLALHACDTATDDALAQAVRRQAAVVLAAPCCHHDVAAQLRRAALPEALLPLTRDGILRERLADTLTDALRASVLRGHGYRTDVVEFVESRHTPRNTLLRAVRTGARTSLDEATALAQAWQVRPRLLELLA